MNTPAPETTRIAPPGPVAFAMRLFFAAVVLGLIIAGLTFAQGGPGAPGAALVGLAFTAFWAWLFWKIGSRRNWARLLLALLFGLCLPVFFFVLRALMQELPMIGIVLAGQIVFMATGCVLLFTPAANRWYRPQVVPQRPAPIDSRTD